MKESDRVRLLTALGPNTNGGIATFNVEGMDMGKLNGWLWNSHKISTAGINHPEFVGMRITPNVYTTLDEIDRFTDKVLLAIKKGVV
jgi:selenocysteine lyase/cysteine desulfurase